LPFKYYLSGFFDGEGNFNIKIRKDKRYKNGFQVTPRIQITQKNKRILEKIKGYLKYGKIYKRKDGLWSFEIYKIKDLQSFTNLIEKNIFVKHKDLKNFKHVLRIVSKKRHLSKEGLDAVRNLKIGRAHV